jgi:outer membrane protein assembly factor BamB
MKNVSAVVWGVVLGGLSVAQAGDWPQFRGPNRDGISTEKSWRAELPADGVKPLWKLNVGRGVPAAVVSQGRLYTLGNVDNHDLVYCLDALTGKEIWRHRYPCDLAPRQFEGGPAATPTLDDGRLYTLSHDGKLFCLDAGKGTVIWQKTLDKLGGHPAQWGYAGSPLVEKDLLIIDAGGDGSSTIAFNKKDGTPVWKAGSDGAGYSSPLAATIAGKRQVLIFKADALVSLEPTTGKELWRHAWKTSYDVNAAMPVVVGDQVLITSGYNTGATLLDVKSGLPVEVWKNKKLAGQMASPVVWQDHIYGISGNAGKGSVVCLRLKDSEQTWADPVSGTGALMLADGKLLIMSERGDLIIAKARPEKFEVLSRLPVLNAKCWVMPVLANGILYARGNHGDIVALDLRGQ